jgi:Nif-specific regulatory protein
MRARLRIKCGEGLPLVCDLTDLDYVTLGRNRQNTIILQDRHASRHHAIIYPEAGRWFIRDCGATNGTLLNGERIGDATPLLDGSEIRIGDTCLAFTEEPSDAGVLEPPPEPIVPRSDTPPVNPDAPSTILQRDELGALLEFMDQSMAFLCPNDLVRRALRTVFQQTLATVCGFLSLEEDDPLPRLVIPEVGEMDVHLSRRCTQQVQTTGRTVWLAGATIGAALPALPPHSTPSPDVDGPGSECASNDSMASYRDVLCILVRGDAATESAGAQYLGALHVYRVGRIFTEREVRFCEAMANYLGKSLRLLRDRRALEADNARLRQRSPDANWELVGTSRVLEEVRERIRRLADRPKVLLLIGESGVGKELVARALHHHSKQQAGPFVAVNCAAITPSLTDSEFFGHCKGSFTDAETDRAGYFQQADMGTLFLDEIGELPLEAQAKLLRVLDLMSFRPVGAQQEVKVDVRVIAATNRDLEREVQEGRFRKDLFFRLNMPLNIPPLRERSEDVAALAEHFLVKLRAEFRRDVRLSESAMRRLREYTWPGNVRQLRSVLENAVAMSDSGVIQPSDLRLAGEGLLVEPDRPSLNLEELEAWAIRQALQQTRGNNTQAARLLGIHRDTLLSKIKKYGIEREA